MVYILDSNCIGPIKPIAFYRPTVKLQICKWAKHFRSYFLTPIGVRGSKRANVSITVKELCFFRKNSANNKTFHSRKKQNNNRKLVFLQYLPNTLLKHITSDVTNAVIFYFANVTTLPFCRRFRFLFPVNSKYWEFERKIYICFIITQLRSGKSATSENSLKGCH